MSAFINLPIIKVIREFLYSDRISSLRTIALLSLIAVFSMGGYLLTSALVYSLGYPLDDAWIHQTYARNLVRIGQWAFIPGTPSAGSTSPLYSLLLSVGYLSKLNPLFWTYLIGYFCLVVLSLSGLKIINRILDKPKGIGISTAIFLLLEWHLVWAAGSGMETLFYAVLILVVIYATIDTQPRWGWIGTIIGVAVWVRPDAITMIGPACFNLFFSASNWRDRFQALIRLGMGIIFLTLPYLFFNWYLGGRLWPNTFFAKQAEYSVLQNLPLWQRFTGQAGLMLVGPGSLLAPGVLIFFVSSMRTKNWVWTSWMIWLIGYLLLYAWRLPVTYQHGRYVIPAMPVFFIFGIAGLDKVFHQKPEVLWKNVILKAWIGSIGLVLIAFWIMGANTYANDVGVIETEMVAAAKWVALYTDPHALIAAHDIGALGYYGDRKLLDLAGLISPDVIPFIRDEDRLGEYLDKMGADFLVTFPGWYPYLIRDKYQCFTTHGQFSPKIGGENMAIYLWKTPGSNALVHNPDRNFDLNFQNCLSASDATMLYFLTRVRRVPGNG
jgi:arabinofuranosyltransferase